MSDYTLTPTGLVVNADGEVMQDKPKARDPDWFKGIRKGFRTLAIMGLSANACYVFFDLAGRLKYGNICIVNQSDIAARLKCSRQSVCKAISQLEANMVIVKHSKLGTLNQYRLNPAYCWLNKG